jgi:hypothetical protein
VQQRLIPAVTFITLRKNICMPNQWSSTAANPANAFDNVGYVYSNITGNKLGCCIDKLYPGSGFSMSDFWNNFPYSEVDAIKYDAPDYYRNAIADYKSKPISSDAKTTMIQLVDYIVGIKTEDYSTIYNDLVQWEASVQNNSQFTNDEKSRLLSASSITRYGILIALQTPDVPTGTNAGAKSIFGKILAGIVGAAVAIFLFAPIFTAGALTVAGYIFYGGLGAWGGVLLYDALF